MSSFDLLPALSEEGDLRFSTDQRRETTSTHDVQAVVDTTLAENAVDGERLSHTSECLGSQVLALKIALNQSRCSVTDHQRIGRSQCLYPCSNVWGFTQGELFLSPTTPHCTDDDEPSMDAYTESELDTFVSLQ